MRAVFLVVVMLLNFSGAEILSKDGYRVEKIELQKRDDESNLKVEVEFGQFKLLDCNSYFYINSNLTTKYDGFDEYYFFSKSDELASTEMLCYGKKKSKFVLYPSKISVDYNSARPITIHLPKEVLVKVSIYKKIESFIKGE